MHQIRPSVAGSSGSVQTTDSGPMILDEQQLQRIKRLGKHLMRVANCLVTFGEITERQTAGDRSMEAIEAMFSDSIPLSGIPVYVPDTRSDRFLATHRQVVGAPYIRFFSSQPIKGPDNSVIGNIRLIDYAPRTLADEEKILLADLAVLVERELQFGAVNASRMELIKKNWNLRRDSMIDPLVGTWNRVAITRLLKQEIQQCRQDEKPLAVVLSDVDAFKQINLSHGRDIGDIMLQKIASRLRSCIRPHDTLGRYEGGKFMIILPGASHLIARQVAERLNQAIRLNPESAGNKVINMTICSGTTSTDTFPAADADELIAHANGALMSAQKMGHNSIAQAMG